jgi:hypothetical protein
MKQRSRFLAVVASVLLTPLAQAHEGFHTPFTHLDPLGVLAVVAIFIAVPAVARGLYR